MLYLYVSYGEIEKGEWEEILESKFRPFKELYPNEKNGTGMYGLNQTPIKLPNGEVVIIDAAFSNNENWLHYIVKYKEEILLTASASKTTLETFDPSATIKLPFGKYLAIMFSSMNEAV